MDITAQTSSSAGRSGHAPAGRGCAAKLTLPSAGEVHLHGTDLDVQAALLPDSGFLSPDELLRADRFRFDRDRRRFIAGRNFLRSVLGRYLERLPGEIQFTYSRQGKPELADAARSLRFNLSHSGPHAIIGIAISSIGVDVEQIRPLPDLHDIARRYFAHGEADEVLAAEGPERLSRFYACWTRTEATLKATGEGMSARDAGRFGGGGRPARLFRAERHVGGGWSVLTPRFRDDVIVAVVVRDDCAWIGMQCDTPGLVST